MAAVDLQMSGAVRPLATNRFLFRPSRSCVSHGFTIIELLVVIVILAILISLLLPVFSSAREMARRVVCLGRMQQVGLAINQYRIANGRFPSATDSPAALIIATPGSTDPADQAGYSWIVRVMPYLEEAPNHSELVHRSSGFGVAPFDEAILVGADAGHISELAIAILRCPSFSGERTVTPTSEGEYGVIQPALTNYMAIVGTHIDETGSDTACPRGMCENGVIVSTQEAGRGLRESSVRDGLANTLLLVESREQSYAAWYDGQTAVVLATPDPRGVNAAPNVVASGKSYTATMHALNFGPSTISNGSPDQSYMLAALVHPGGGGENSNANSGNPNGGGQGSGNGGSNGNGGGNGNGQGPSGDGNNGNGVGNTGPGNQGNDGIMGNAGGIPRPYKSDRWWGPSSEHAGGYILHVFADGHAISLREEVDATIYLQLVTRNGRESVTLD